MEELATTIVDKKYKDQYITVSNSMIRARENTTLLESKIEALAMYNLAKDTKYKRKKDSLGKYYTQEYVEIPVRDIAELIPQKCEGAVYGSLYERIRDVALSMKQKILIIEDKENNRFVLKNMYGDIIYDNGVLNIEFEPTMKKYFLGLKQNFSKLSLPILFKFKKNGGFQLYKLLKSYAYPPNLPKINMSLSQEDLPSYAIYWNLTDLKMQMGYVDLTQPLLKKEGAKDHPNWEKMEEIDLGTKMYSKWTNLYNRILKPGIEEINSLSDIYIDEMEKHLKGHGGKVVGITFHIKHNKTFYENKEDISNKNPEVALSEEEKADFVYDLMDLFYEKIKAKDLKTIAEVAGYDYERIKKIYNISKQSTGIDDIVGWMIAGLKGNYSEPVKSKGKNKDFNSFKQRKYDYEELEKTALGN